MTSKKIEGEGHTEMKVTIDKGVQVLGNELSKYQSFYSRIGSDAELSTLTGISTLKIFQGIVECVKLVVPNIQYNSKICLEDKIIMTCMKLKQNMTYAMLNVLFKCCSVQNCRNTVLKLLDVLSKILDCAIVFPTKEEFSRNVPLCFEQF